MVRGWCNGLDRLQQRRAAQVLVFVGCWVLVLGENSLDYKHDILLDETFDVVLTRFVHILRS